MARSCRPVDGTIAPIPHIALLGILKSGAAYVALRCRCAGREGQGSAWRICGAKAIILDAEHGGRAGPSPVPGLLFESLLLIGT